MRKKTVIGASVLLAAMALAACTPTATTSSSDTSSAGTTSESTTSSKRLEVEIVNKTIPAGSTFFDGCKPTIIYYDGDEQTDMTNYFNQVRYTINPVVGGTPDTSVNYDASDALPTGTYQVTITAKSRHADLEITVEPGDVTTASEGNGYKTVYSTDEDFSRLALGQADSSLGTLGVGNFPSTGTPKVLVVPVIFKGMETATGNKGAYSDSEIDIIRRAYIGGDSNASDEDKTAWESLKTYYEKSSYGKLSLDAFVTDQFVYEKSANSLDPNKAAETQDIASAAFNWFKTTYPEEAQHISDYDANGDGYVDSINLIYKTTAEVNSSNPSELWWNFTSNMGLPAGTQANPTLHRYFWATYDFIYKPSYYPTDDYPVDAHVLVHEHGHAIGLSDYYSYDTNSTGGKDEAPAGCADMMDMNVGDHNAYSKMRFNWLRDNADDEGVNLMYVDGSNDDFTITLNSFADEGDVLLVRNTTTDPWNGTPYDEYLLFTYYTPTGVNEADSHGYAEWMQYNEATGTTGAGNGGPYRHAGVQVFHVDARTAVEHADLKANGTIDESTATYEYTDEVPTKATTVNGKYTSAATFITDNTPSRSSKIVDGKLVGGGDAEIEAILSSGDDGFRSSSYANLMGIQSNLFGTEEYANEKEFDSKEMYGGYTYSNFMAWRYFENELVWNDGSTLNWTISVESQTDTSATLHLVNNDAIGK